MNQCQLKKEVQHLQWMNWIIDEKFLPWTREYLPMQGIPPQLGTTVIAEVSEVSCLF